MPINTPEKHGPVADVYHWWLRQKCPTEFLCDSCKYDYDAACHRPASERGHVLIIDRDSRTAAGLTPDRSPLQAERESYCCLG